MTYRYFKLDGKPPVLFREVRGPKYLDLERLTKDGIWLPDSPGLARYVWGMDIGADPISQHEAQALAQTIARVAI